MLVKAMIMSKEFSDKSDWDTGDIAFFWPIDWDHGDKMFKNMMAVVMDINIPCTEAFNYMQPPPCNNCKDNHIDTCDMKKYTRGIFGKGAVLTEPPLLKNRKFYIDRTKIVSPESEALIVKTDKTKEENELMVKRALENPQDKSLIIEKGL